MNFNALRYVIKIAEERNITKAAEKLYVTQSALSQNLRSLENELDFQIFDRDASPLVPTEAGKFFIEWANRVLYSETEMLHKLQDISQTKRRVLRIGLSPQKSVHIFPKVLKQFYQEQPECKIILEEHPSDVLLNMLEQNEIDILFDINHSEYIEYDFEPVAEERIRIAAPIDMVMTVENNKGDYPTVSLAEVMQHPFISLSERQYLGKVVKQLYDISECISNIVLECRSADMALQLVGAGLGVTVIPEFAIREEKNGKIKYYNLEYPEIRRIVGISYKKGMYLTEDVKLLIRLLKKYLQQ